MSDYKKPLPEIQPHSQGFWDGTRQHKLLIQHCNSCGENIFYPRRDCPKCWSQDLGWIESSGRATVYTYSVTYEGVEEMFVEDLPIILRGSKRAVEERDPDALYALACERGWPDSCGRGGP